MTDFKSELREILKNQKLGIKRDEISDGLSHSFSIEPYVRDVEESIDDIIALFISKGWHTSKHDNGACIVIDERGDFVYAKQNLSGQEWYNKFKKEYRMRADWIGAEPEMGEDAEHDVLLAARLASGIKGEIK